MGFLAATLTGPTALGETARKRVIALVYERSADASSCPDEQELREGVASQLGYDPFSAGAKEKLEILIHRRGKLWATELTLWEGGGEPRGTREIESPGDDCRELAGALVLAVAIAIDPVHVARPVEHEALPPAPVPTPATPPPPAPMARPSPPPRPRPPRPRQSKAEPMTVALSAGVVGSLGSAPAPAAGVWVQAASRWPRWSVALEGRADLPASRDFDGASLNASLLLASLVPCHHAGGLHGCGLISVGALQGSGEGVDVPRKQTTVFAGAGARCGLDLRLSASLALVVHADVRGNFTRTTLRLGGRGTWTTPPVNGAAGLGIRGRFE